MKTTLLNNNRFTYDSIKNHPLYRMNEDYYKSLFEKNLYNIASTESNLIQFKTSLIYLLLSCKAHYDSKHKVIKSFIENPKSVEKYFVKNEEVFSLLVPRSRSKTELNQKLKDSEPYIHILENDLQIKNYRIFVYAQDTLFNLDIVDKLSGGLLYNGDTYLTSLTIKPIEKWDLSFIKNVPSDYKIEIANTFGTKEYSDFYRDMFLKKDYAVFDEYVRTTISKKKYKKEGIDNYFVKSINTWNKQFELTKNVRYFATSFKNEYKYNKTKKINGRIYSPISFCNKKLRKIIFDSENLVEVDQTASQINKLYLLSTGSMYDSERHPTKDFIQYLTNSRDSKLNSFLYKELKQLVIASFNCSKKSFYKKVEAKLVELGLYSNDFLRNSDEYKKASKDMKKYLSINFFERKRIERKELLISHYKKNNPKDSIVYNGSLNIKPKEFVKKLETFFFPIQQFLYRNIWIIDQQIDYLFSIECLRYCKQNYIPFITIHDAIYVPEQLKEKTEKFIKEAMILSVNKYKKNNDFTKEYTALFNQSFGSISRGEVLSAIKSNESVHLRKLLVSVYKANLKKVKLLKEISANHLSSDTYFNSIPTTITKKELVKYVNSLPINVLISLCIYYYSNEFIPYLNLDSLCKIIYSHKYINKVYKKEIKNKVSIIKKNNHTQGRVKVYRGEFLPFSFTYYSDTS